MPHYPTVVAVAFCHCPLCGGAHPPTQTFGAWVGVGHHRGQVGAMWATGGGVLATSPRGVVLVRTRGGQGARHKALSPHHPQGGGDMQRRASGVLPSPPLGHLLAPCPRPCPCAAPAGPAKESCGGWWGGNRGCCSCLASSN